MSLVLTYKKCTKYTGVGGRGKGYEIRGLESILNS